MRKFLKLTMYLFDKYFPRFITYELEIVNIRPQADSEPKNYIFISDLHPQLLQILKGIDGYGKVEYSFFNLFGKRVLETYRRME